MENPLSTKSGADTTSRADTTSEIAALEQRLAVDHAILRHLEKTGRRLAAGDIQEPELGQVLDFARFAKARLADRRKLLEAAGQSPPYKIDSSGALQIRASLDPPEDAAAAAAADAAVPCSTGVATADRLVTAELLIAANAGVARAWAVRAEHIQDPGVREVFIAAAAIGDEARKAGRTPPPPGAELLTALRDRGCSHQHAQECMTAGTGASETQIDRAEQTVIEAARQRALAPIVGGLLAAVEGGDRERERALHAQYRAKSDDFGRPSSAAAEAPPRAKLNPAHLGAIQGPALALAELCDIDEYAAGLLCIGTAAACMQGAIDVEHPLMSRELPVSLFTIVVGDPGSGKSTAASWLKPAFGLTQSDQGRYLRTDMTTEYMTGDMYTDGRAKTLWTDEASVVLQGHAWRDPQEKRKTIGTWCGLYSGELQDRKRASDSTPVATIERPRFSILMLGQPAAVAALQDLLPMRLGLPARLLYADLIEQPLRNHPTDPESERMLREREAELRGEVERFTGQLRDAFSGADAYDGRGAAYTTARTEQPALTWAPDAVSVLRQYRNECEVLKRAAEDEYMKYIFSRLPEQAVRVAAVVAMVGRLGGYGRVVLPDRMHELTPEDAERGIAIVDVSRANHERLRTSAASPDDDATLLRDWIVRYLASQVSPDGREFIRHRDIQRLGPAQLRRNVTRRAKAIRALEQDRFLLPTGQQGLFKVSQ